MTTHHFNLISKATLVLALALLLAPATAGVRGVWSKHINWPPDTLHLQEKHNVSNRISLLGRTLIGGFNSGYDNFSYCGRVDIELTDGAPFGCKPHEGSHALMVKPPVMPAREWRYISRLYEVKPLDLSKTPIVHYAVLTGEGPALKQWTRLRLSDGKQVYDAVAQIIPVLWRNVAFDVSGCKFLKNVRYLQVGVMCESDKPWDTGRNFMIDGIEAGAPLDLQFMSPLSAQAFSATGGKIGWQNDALTFKFKKAGGSAVQCDQLARSLDDIASPDLALRNTVRVVLANHSRCDSLRLSFTTVADGTWSSSKSKTFAIKPMSGYTSYYLNLSDVPAARGNIAGLRLEPVGEGGGSWSIDRITFERERAITQYAGAIASCTATAKRLYIKGSVSDEYLNRYRRFAIYEKPFIKDSGTTDLKMAVPDGGLVGLKLLYEGPVTKDIDLDQLPNSRLGGRMTHLSTRFLAVVKNNDSDFMPVAPCFFVENWEDFGEKNPYAFTVPSAQFNVLDYGARGDGFTDDTKAIQQAIDACRAAGGGRVVLPGSGDEYGRRYVATSLRLGSNMEFHLERGTVLWQSGDRRDYGYVPAYGHDFAIPATPWTHSMFMNMPLLYAYREHNVKVTGPGIIRMNDSYCLDPDWAHYARTCADRLHVCALAFQHCRNIELKNFDEVRASNYNTDFLGDTCVYIGNVKLYDVQCVSGDGFSFWNGTTGVYVDRCFLDSNDDGIVLVDSYRDPRGKVSPWMIDDDAANHCIRNIRVERSYINSATGGAGKAIAFIPWGSTNPDLTKQETDSIFVTDCVLTGGHSVGTWCDNPFDGKPFTGAEADDYSPIKNVRILNNEYASKCDMLTVKTTNFITDCGLHSASSFLNGNFEQGHCSWTMTGDAGAAAGEGWAHGGGRLAQGLYLQPGDYTVTATVKGNGSVFAQHTLTGIDAAKAVGFAGNDWQQVELKLHVGSESDYMIGIAGGDAKIKSCSIAKE